jgi:hypothetical protein
MRFEEVTSIVGMMLSFEVEGRVLKSPEGENVG